MPNLNLYIPQPDIPLWGAARRIARARGISVYRLVTEALQRHLPDAETNPADRWNEIAKDAA